MVSGFGVVVVGYEEDWIDEEDEIFLRIIYSFFIFKRIS